MTTSSIYTSTVTFSNGSITNSTTSVPLITTTTTTTMLPIPPFDYQSNDGLIALIIFFNFCSSCCLLICVAYNREVFCFSPRKPNRKKMKSAEMGAEAGENENDDVEEV